MLPTNTQVYLDPEQASNPNKKRTLSAKKRQEVLEECKKNIGRWFDYFSTNIQNFRQDKQFYYEQQWSNYEWNYYSQIGKVPYTFNKLKPLVRQLCGEQVNMQPQLNLIPKDVDSANPQSTLILTKFLRALAYDSKASEAYADCFKNQCVGGWGVLQVDTDYEDPFKFDQKIIINSIPDPLTVGFDPNAQKADKTDGDFQFQYEIMDKDDFQATYPNADVPLSGQLLGTARDFLPQMDNKSVIVTNYYVKEYKSKTLIQLTNHEDFKIEVLSTQVDEITEQYAQFMALQGAPEEMVPPLVESNRRNTKLTYIHCYKCTATEIIEHSEWHSDNFPFVFVDAMSSFSDGKQMTESFIHGARDAQKTYNYCMSEAINGLAKLRREQVWMTRRQAEGHEDFLRYPDRQQSHAEYNFDNEVPSGPIFRPPEQLPADFFELARAAEEDIYKTLGIYPAQRGELPNQTSGVAIGRTIVQGNLAFIQLLQNLYNGMQSIGETILDLIPKLYDTQRIVSVLDEAGNAENITLNEAQGSQIKNSMSDLVYKLQVKPVASFAIQQEQIQAQLFKLSSINESVFPLIADLVASTIESPIAPLLNQRLKTLVPQNILRKEQGLPPLPPSPDPQAQMAQAQLGLEQMKSQKLQADMQNDKMDMYLKQQKLLADQRQSQANSVLEAQKIQVSKDETVAATEKSYIDAKAEIDKANMQRSTEAMKVLKDIHLAGVKASQKI